MSRKLKLVGSDFTIVGQFQGFMVPTGFDGGTNAKDRLKATVRRVRKALNPWNARRQLKRHGFNQHDFAQTAGHVRGTSDGGIRIKRTIQADAYRGTKSVTQTIEAKPGEMIVISPFYGVRVFPDSAAATAFVSEAREVADE